jgi:hypothetical protein
MNQIENIVSNNTPIVVSVITDLLLRKGLHNPVFLLLRACMLQAFSSSGRCLQSLLSNGSLCHSIILSLLGNGLVKKRYRRNEYTRNIEELLDVSFYVLSVSYERKKRE